ncbi:MAG: threonine/serine dehydratase [Bacteroidetes bacterium]|nr:MAG: threonine/serine dehydratase [Bacteroidota bacterium]RLD86638.1 MAG: threonine/serine dehydratase [Bacteroidota bacterium]
MKDQSKQIYKRIKKEIKKTPLEYNSELSEKTGAKIFLKTENKQITGSFKFRGAISKLNYLRDLGVTNKKIVTASTGNHAAAVAMASQKMGFEALIFVPETISKVKLEFIKQYDVEIIKKGRYSAETEILAAEYAQKMNLKFLHPYSDPQIIAGQGTIAIELLEQLPELDAVFVPIGGGGLISGIAQYLKSIKPAIKIIGCQAHHAPEMIESIKLGKIVPPSEKNTIADGAAGGLDPETITFNICQKYVDDYVLLTEEEIGYALYQIYKTTQQIVEPAAALSVAAILKIAKDYKDKNLVAILSGSRVNKALFDEIIKRYRTDD